MMRSLSFLIVLILWQGTASAQSLLESVFTQLQQHPHGSVSYVEEKHLAMLDIPLTQSGYLSYTPPDTLVREQKSPRAQRFTLTGDRVVIESGSERREIDLRSVPALQAFIESMRAMMAADLTALQRHYEVKATGSDRQWTLHLVPRDKTLHRYIDTLELTGSGGELQSIKTYESGGDWSLMRLTADHGR